MPYFEMSLENDREYVYQNDSSVVEVPSRFMRKIICRLRLNEVSRQ